METRFHNPYRHFAAGIVYTAVFLVVVAGVLAAIAFIVALIAGA